MKRTLPHALAILPLLSAAPVLAQDGSKDDKPPAADASTARKGAAIGISPNVPQIVGGGISATQAEELAPTATSGSSDEWKMDFHGYMRAPLRLSWGPETLVQSSAGPMMPDHTTDPHDNTAMQGKSFQLHTTPRNPGLSYTDWNYTNTTPGPWAQLNFSYGNSRAAMTIIVGSYSLTTAGYRNLQAQQGIDQAFVTVNFPEAFGDMGGLVWTVGAFNNRYGTAGKYDGGAYETYLFGRTRVAGSTLQANLDLGGPFSLTIEQGLGAKIEIQAFTNNGVNQVFQIPTPYNDQSHTAAGYGSVYNRDREDLPYQGPVPQGSTLVHHYHLGLAYKKLLVFGAHFLQSYTPDDNWNPQNDFIPNTSDRLPRRYGPQPGRMTIYGGDIRLSGGVLGEGYLGYSHIGASNVLALADAIEVLHSFAGWNFKQNFFGRTYDPHTGTYQGPQNESGTVDTILAQYTFSLGALVNYPGNFWGQGPDLNATVFGMLNLVDSKGTAASSFKTKKLKYGLDVAYIPLSWVGVGIRGDVVQPDLDATVKDGNDEGNAGSVRNFKVITPRIVFRTGFLTHETITVQYSHYFLGDRAYPTYPYEFAVKSDADMFAVAATMWW